MSLWLNVRGASMIAGAMLLTLVGLALPAASATAAPSPIGPALAAALFLALAVPVAIGWGCGRGDPQLETVSTRPIRWLDLSLAVVAPGLSTILALVMHEAGMAPAGLIAARALIVYLGLLLLAYPITGWRVAAVVPALYLLAVAVAGRGEDIFHPAPWAWIAADGLDRTSWVLSAAVLGIGVLSYALLERRTAEANDPGE